MLQAATDAITAGDGVHGQRARSMCLFIRLMSVGVRTSMWRLPESGVSGYEELCRGCRTELDDWFTGRETDRFTDAKKWLDRL